MPPEGICDHCFRMLCLASRLFAWLICKCSHWGNVMSKPAELTCSECGPLNCYRQEKMYPPFCLTEAADEQQVASVVELLRGDNPDGRMARAASEIEGLYYGKATRVEEIVLFAKRIGAQRIGVATCRGLIEEARIFVKVLRAKGLEPYTVVCKVGSVDKREIGVSGRSAPAKRRVRGDVQPGSAGAIAQ